MSGTEEMLHNVRFFSSLLPSVTTLGLGFRTRPTTCRLRALARLTVLLFTVLAVGCATLPTDYEHPTSHALRDTTDTKLGKMFAPQVAAHGDLSGVYPLNSGLDALAARIGLANAAERSLDAQYYIWSGDLTGKLMLDALLRAADRGVRVRLLLDDLSHGGYDKALIALDLHPDVEVRLFNPFAQRRFRGFEMLARFSRLNRRMHNKAFIVDNQVAIVGGRNIGNEYFEAKPELDYRDFDVLTVGPVVPEVSHAFDVYWNSDLSVPVAAFAEKEPATQADLAELRKRLAAHTLQAEQSEYAEAVRSGDFVREVRSGKFQLLWAKAYVVYDDPDKFTTDPNDRSSHLGPQLQPLLENLHSQLFIVSPYFVPGESGVALFQELVNRGVHVRILTNSLASSDVSVVAAGYSRYRIPLLRAGVELYELKPSARRSKSKNKGGVMGSLGSSRGSLHAKVFVFDRENIFVGSMNLDPRSARLNSEMGVIIEDKQLAQGFVANVDKRLPTEAYHLRLEYEPGWDEESAPQPKIVWETENDKGEKQTYDTDPEASLWRRFNVWFMSIFVPEGQL